MRDIITILYNGFETLDVFGPIEVFGRLPEQFNPLFYSMAGGIITSTQKVPVMTQLVSELKSSRYILFIPGGIGAKEEINRGEFIAALRSLAGNAEFIITVCTGSILLSRTGLLDGRRATSNKMAFAWTRTAPSVTWIKKARWVKDGTIYTSSGVSAGTDMALGFIADQLGNAIAQQVSREIEYTWNENPGLDPFAELYP
ncbi:DJ-1/PfpI family protein [uncultured Methanoregula sp.]|uniref:DJ-1/PfpI family protein n=1 Tax=uncultured Methanoregula sp. TaxID=1005933 RepID=UPI002AAAFDF1|nr:DJ-1/PfpI family protein [uncultured Methanoregula sp.]